MKKNFAYLLLICCCQFFNGQSFKVMSYNIKYDNTKDTINNWNDRKSEMVALLNRNKPQVLGIQEGLHHQVKYLNEHLKNFTYVGVGRDDGKQKGEYSAIFYHTPTFELLDSGTFWLSPTPQKISKGWDASLERICTYAKLKQKSSKRVVWVFNAHFDHRGQTARVESAKLIANYIEKIANKNTSIVVMGDLNAYPEDAPITLLKSKFEDSKNISQQKFSGPSGTFNGFKPMVRPRRIDYIFTQNLSILNYQHLDDKLKSGKWISDHLPVLSEMEFKN